MKVGSGYVSVSDTVNELENENGTQLTFVFEDQKIFKNVVDSVFVFGTLRTVDSDGTMCRNARR